MNEYYILGKICNVIWSEQSAILVQIYILPVFKSDWQTKKIIISVAKSVLERNQRNKQNDILYVNLKIYPGSPFSAQKL